MNWSGLTTAPAKIGIKLCYTADQTVDRAWRKYKDNIKDNKRCKQTADTAKYLVDPFDSTALEGNKEVMIPMNTAPTTYTVQVLAMDADGAFISARDAAVVGGNAAGAPALRRRLGEAGSGLPLQEALRRAIEVWAAGRLMETEEADPDEEQVAEFLGRELAGTRLEAAVLDRTLPPKTKFRLLADDALREVTASYSS